MKTHILISVIFLLTLSNCDYLVTWEYFIKNSTNDTLTIEYSYQALNYETHPWQTYFRDSIVILNPNDSVLVFETGTAGGVRGFDIEKCDTLRVFRKLNISKNGANKYDENYLSRDVWKYDEYEQRKCKYLLEIE